MWLVLGYLNDMITTNRGVPTEVKGDDTEGDSDQPDLPDRDSPKEGLGIGRMILPSAECMQLVLRLMDRHLCNQDSCTFSECLQPAAIFQDIAKQVNDAGLLIYKGFDVSGKPQRQVYTIRKANSVCQNVRYVA